jgi:regulator of protease activity HflC (stomatin/prohibitin superfamily)
VHKKEDYKMVDKNFTPYSTFTADKDFRVNFVSVLVFLIISVPGIIYSVLSQFPVIGIAAVIIAWLFSLSPKIAKQWEKGIVLRFGKFHRLIGPGLFWIFPLVDKIAIWIDQRVMTTTFLAEQTLTKDTVPVNVDAVLFWVVWDAKKAALEVQNYQTAISWASQTALRDIIGKTELASLLSGREQLDKELQKVIDSRSEPWGITVQSVEIRDVVIPEQLQDAMSRQAQAERERQARVILGDAENQIAAKFASAAEQYKDNPIALHLRAMNMLYEGLKEKGALVIVPSTAVESMGLGTLTGLTSLYSVMKKGE